MPQITATKRALHVTVVLRPGQSLDFDGSIVSLVELERAAPAPQAEPIEEPPEWFITSAPPPHDVQEHRPVVRKLVIPQALTPQAPERMNEEDTAPYFDDVTPDETGFVPGSEFGGPGKPVDPVRGKKPEPNNGKVGDWDPNAGNAMVPGARKHRLINDFENLG
jgi:hypothetical protein